MVCERVRAQVSLELDDELSQLERRMLDAHLICCPDCRAYAADVAAFTTELRAAPLEQIERAIIVHRPRRGSLARLQVGVAAAVAIAILGFVLQLDFPGAERSSTVVRTPTRFPTLAEGRSEMLQITADGRAFHRHRSGSSFVI